MMKKGQKVEGGVFVSYFSANVRYIERNVLQMFCSGHFRVSNENKRFFN